MLFNSLQFLVFFPLVTVIYFLLPHRFRWLHLLIASCFFYMAFVPIYILILFFTIVIDYIAGIAIEDGAEKNKRLFLIASIVANVGVLAFFKYFNFFTDNVNTLLGALHITTYSLPYLNILLPIGLSFHTFQAMSYTIEVYRENQKAERHFGIYALYVMFYPQLVAGPIERPQNLLWQFKEDHKFNSQNLLDGFRLMLWGFFKKLVIADHLALYVNTVFHAPGQYHYMNLVIAVCFFTIQIYCDFSGYSDIAIGTAKVMGFELMVNFRRPLISKNLTDLWRRWHISMTTWFTDYLYSPIVTKYRRSGPKIVYAGILLTFLISGLWHGAGWTFIVCGGLNGVGLVYELITINVRRKVSSLIPSMIYTPISVLLTFLYLSFCEIFFRSNSWATAMLIIRHIFTLDHTHPFSVFVKDLATKSEYGPTTIAIAMSMTMFMLISESRLKVDMSDFNNKPVLDILFCTFVLISVIMLGMGNNSSFIYFQF